MEKELRWESQHFGKRLGSMLKVDFRRMFTMPLFYIMAGSSGIIMCLLSKILLMAVFVSIYLFMSVVAKQKTWLAMTGSFCIGVLLFMMIPMLTPLNAGIGNVVGCLIGGVLFGLGFGALGNQVLKRMSLV